MSKIGFHYSSNNGLEKHWDSTVSLVLAMNVGGETDRVKAVSQWNDLVVYRAWQYGSLGRSDSFEDYYRKYGISPTPLVELHKPVFDALRGYRVTYQFFNETGGGPDIWDKFIEFNCNLVEEMDVLYQSACVLNMFTGTPAGTREEIRDTWVKARPLFETIRKSYVRHYIGLHEYTGYPSSRCEPYYIGRYKWMLEDAGTDDLAVIINEFGYTTVCDYDNDQVSGYQGWLNRGLTPEQLADDMYDAHQRIYEPDEHVIGTCYFCMGDSGGWEHYDLTKEPRILARLKDRINQVETYVVLADSLNVRASPSVTSTSVGKLLKGQQIQLRPDWVENGDYRWRQLSDGRWVAEFSLSTGDKYIETITKPSEIDVLLDEIELRLGRIRSLVKG